MRVKIEMHIEVDPATWAETNGMNHAGRATVAEIREDIRSFVFHTVQQMPMMEDTEAFVSRAS